MPQTKKRTYKKSTGKNSSTSGKTVSRKPAAKKPIRREVGAVICLFLGLFSFIGYFNVDAWLITLFCDVIKGLIGWGFYIFPPALLLTAGVLGFHRGRPVIFRLVCAVLLPFILGAIVHILIVRTGSDYSWDSLKELYPSGALLKSGGFISGLLGMSLVSALSVYGALPLLIVIFLFFSISAANITIGKVIRYFRDMPKTEYIPEPEFEKLEEKTYYEPTREVVYSRSDRRHVKSGIDISVEDEPVKQYSEERIGFFNTKPRVKFPDQVLEDAPTTQDNKFASGEHGAHLSEPQSGVNASIQAIKSGKISSDEIAIETESITKAIESVLHEEKQVYQYPPITLLKTSKRGNVDGREEIALNRERLESTIHSFGVNAAITGVTRGPTVTRYDLELEAGVKLNKLTNLAGDLALSLGVSCVRIAPIPNKISTVGIEVPNKLVSLVYLHDIIDSPPFRNASSKLTFAIGEDIGGSSIVGNIAKLPHMLIAGTTGSGKSVCMNSLIISLFYKATPDELRLIMIDPKMVELGVYNGIPHLFIPVVTDPKKASGALQWAVVEMMKRYRLFAEAGVRDIVGYNEYQKRTDGVTIPQVVIVIDELADLMLAASKEVEESICRVAQMGRASGMHLIIATQRPSADVITGLMKANIPSRIAFAVSSAMESRIILDAQGAEKLIGCGDMLYSPLGSGKPTRIQGAFVTDEEREDVIKFVKSSFEAHYNDEIMAHIEKAAEEKSSGVGAQEKEDANAFSSNYDDLLTQAVDVIFETKQASVSMLQRRLKLGYARAARIVDQMEEMGIVGSFEGSKPRQILISKQQWQEMQMMHGTAPMDTIDDQLEFELTEDDDI